MLSEFQIKFLNRLKIKGQLFNAPVLVRMGYLEGITLDEIKSLVEANYVASDIITRRGIRNQRMTLTFNGMKMLEAYEKNSGPFSNSTNQVSV